MVLPHPCDTTLGVVSRRVAVGRPTPRAGPQDCVGGDPRVGAAPPEPRFARNGAMAITRGRFVAVSAERRRARTGGSDRGSVHPPTRPAKKTRAHSRLTFMIMSFSYSQNPTVAYVASSDILTWCFYAHCMHLQMILGYM